MKARFGLALAITAIGAALFAIGFRSALAAVYQGLYHDANVVDSIRSLPAWGRFAVPIAGAAVAGLIARWRASGGQGVSNVMEAVALGTIRLSLRTTLSRVTASWSAIASGVSIGREGPLIEFGGTLGSSIGAVLHLTSTQRRLLIGAGTAAGFAAAYNTPFAATLFVIETLVGFAPLDLLLPTITSTVLATALTRAVVGGGPIYGQRAFSVTSNWEFFAFAAVGLVAAGAGLVFKDVLARFERWFTARQWPQPFRAMVGGAVVGLAVVALPDVAGNGYEPLNALLDGRTGAMAALVIAIAKIVATSASVASGMPGGIFTPMLLVGGATGALAAQLLAHSGLLPAVDTGGLALVGMAAATASSIHAPLTAAVLVFELSGDYAIVLPLLLATTIATGVSRGFGRESVYEAELHNTGLTWRMTLDGRHVIEERD